MDSHGKLTTSLSSYAAKDLKSISDDEITTALQDSLQCRLQNVRIRKHKKYFHVSADRPTPLQKTDFMFQGIVKPDPVRKCLEKLGPAKIELFLAIPKLGYVRGPQEGRERPAYGSYATYVLEFSAQGSAVTDVPSNSVIARGDVIWMLAPLVPILIVPILLVVRVRKKTLRLAETDATCCLVRLLAGTSLDCGRRLAALARCSRLPPRRNLCQFVFGIDHPSLYVVLLFVPPAVVSFVCQYLSRPVWLRVRGTQWDRREMLIRGFLEHAVAICPWPLSS